MTNDEFEFNKKWLDTTDYELKILMLISILSENNLAYRGSLKTMCEWLNLCPHPDAYKRIQKAIDTLEKKKYVHHIQEGKTHTLSISNKGLADKRSIKVRKAWIETIRNYKSSLPETILSVEWSKLVKVFIYCLCDNGDIQTLTNRAEELHISKDTFSRSLQILAQLDLEPLTIDFKTRKRYFRNQNYWETIGSSIVVGMDFNKQIPEDEITEQPSVGIPYWPDPEEYDYESLFATYE